MKKRNVVDYSRGDYDTHRDSRISKLAISTCLISILTFPCVLHAIMPLHIWEAIGRRTGFKMPILLWPAPALMNAIIATIAFLRVRKSKGWLSGLGFALFGAVVSLTSGLCECALLFMLMNFSPR